MRMHFIILLIMLPFASGQVVLESNWDTELGGSDNATSDGGKFNQFYCTGRENVQEVVAAPASWTHSSNILQMTMDGEQCALIQNLEDAIPFGENYYLRSYIMVESGDGATNHPYKTGWRGSNSIILWNIGVRDNNAGTYTSAIRMDPARFVHPTISQTWALNFDTPPIPYNEFWRFEHHFEYVGDPNLYRGRVWPEVYDEQGVLQFTADNYTLASGKTLSEVWADGGYYQYGESDGYTSGHMHSPVIGYEGPFGAPSSQDKFYFAGFSACLDEWCGPIGTQQQGICEATGGGTCYYIDPVNGIDINNGSFEAPWKSFKNLNWRYARCEHQEFTLLNEGDVVYLREGVHDTVIGSDNDQACEGGRNYLAILRNLQGSEANPIKIKAYPGERPVIGDVSQYDEFLGFYLLDSNWVEVSGIEMRNVPGNCMEVYNSADIKVYDVEIHDCGRKETGGNPAGLMFRDAYRTEVFNSSFYDTFRDPSLGYRGAGVQYFIGGNHTAHNNTFHNTKQGINPDSSLAGYPNCIFQKHASPEPDSFLHVYNNSLRNCGKGTNGMFFAMGSNSQNTHFHHNLVENSRTGFMSIDFGGPTHQENQLIEYNTFIDTRPLLLHYDSQVSNIIFRNNIVTDDESQYWNERNTIDVGTYDVDSAHDALINEITFENNCYYNPNTALRINFFGPAIANGATGGFYSFTEWQSLGFDVSSFDVDPMFVDYAGGDYRIQSGSPCEDKGVYALSVNQTQPTNNTNQTFKEGDVNRDGEIGILDILAVLADFNRTPGPNTDLNLDGRIDLFDLVIVARNWGK